MSMFTQAISCNGTSQTVMWKKSGKKSNTLYLNSTSSSDSVFRWQRRIVEFCRRNLLGFNTLQETRKSHSTSTAQANQHQQPKQRTFSYSTGQTDLQVDRDHDCSSTSLACNNWLWCLLRIAVYGKKSFLCLLQSRFTLIPKVPSGQ